MGNLIIALGAVAVVSAIVMVCVNISIVPMFGLNEVTYLQAVGLTLLIGLIKPNNGSTSK